MKEYRQVNTWGPRLCYVAVKSDSPSEDIPVSHLVSHLGITLHLL